MLLREIWKNWQLFSVFSQIHHWLFRNLLILLSCILKLRFVLTWFSNLSPKMSDTFECKDSLFYPFDTLQILTSARSSELLVNSPMSGPNKFPSVVRLASSCLVQTSFQNCFKKYFTFSFYDFLFSMSYFSSSKTQKFYDVTNPWQQY